MNETYVSLATVLDSAPADEAVPTGGPLPPAAPLEFIGSSDDTIAEAVRRALSHASVSLRTLDGVGVIVIPQIDRNGRGPRFQVTLRVSQTVPASTAHASQA
jgi:flavin-binding protein dodecin